MRLSNNPPSGGPFSEGSDAELLLQSRQDPEAFGEFYRRYVRHMIALFWHRTRDRDVVSDLVAETFATALENIERFNAAKGSPRQWLYGIANNQLKKYWRRQSVSEEIRRRLKLETPTTPTSGWNQIEAFEDELDNERLLKALDRVPARSRQAVKMRVVEQLEYTEIAERLRCSPKSARDLVFRGLKRLRTEFKRP